jgi:DNA-binding NtrC family response regulator
VAEILIADDDPDIRSLLTAYLQGLGHQIEEAADGNSALNLLGTGRFKIALLDVVMPRVNGIETIVETQRQVPETKIIAMSGDGHTGTGGLASAEKLGVETMAKPFKLSDLRNVIQRCLESGDSSEQ